MGKNKIGICEWVTPIMGPYMCKFAREMGYDGLQLLVGWWENRFELSRKATQDAYKEMAALHGIEFASITQRSTDFFSAFAPEGSEDREIVAISIRKAIEVAAAMDIDIVMLPFFVKSEAKTEEHYKILVSTLRWACDMAADSGITIALENLFLKDDVERTFNDVDRANLKLYFDLQNYYLATKVDTPALLRELLPYTVQIHAKDGKNNDLSGAPLGEGDVSLMESFAVMKEFGYDGWVVNENYYNVPPLVEQEDDPVEAIRKDVATLRKAFG